MKRILAVLCVLALTARAEPTLKKTTWRGIGAFTLSDGRSEAVVVPKLGGRVVSFGLVGGANWLWLGEPGSESREPTQFWGGDKTYIGPHSAWRLTMPRAWPPPAPDSTEHAAEVLDGGALRTVSPPWENYDGARITREYRFEANGDFVIRHSIAAVPGSRAIGSMWTVAQTVPATIFVPLNATSPYRDNFVWFDFAKPKENKGATVLSPTLLRLDPVPGEGFKLGSHPPEPAIAAIRENIAFVQKAEPQRKGDYPEGADGAGLSVEVYHHDARGEGEYLELEFLSPLRRLDTGATLTTRWKIHALPDGWDAKMIGQLMGGK